MMRELWKGPKGVFMSYSHERAPGTDGRWRETLVTQQSTLTTGPSYPELPLLCVCLCVCARVCMRVCCQAGLGHSSQDSRLHGVSAKPSAAHTQGIQPQSCSCLGPFTFSLGVPFFSFLPTSLSQHRYQAKYMHVLMYM